MKPTQFRGNRLLAGAEEMNEGNAVATPPLTPPAPEKESLSLAGYFR